MRKLKYRNSYDIYKEKLKNGNQMQRTSTLKSSSFFMHSYINCPVISSSISLYIFLSCFVCVCVYIVNIYIYIYIYILLITKDIETEGMRLV